VSLELFFLFGSHTKAWESFVSARLGLGLHDVVPQPLMSLREPASGKLPWYFEGNIPKALRDEFDAGIVKESTHFPYEESGEIHPPRNYDVESNYSKTDIEKMKRALKIAYRYADINKAIEDGYRIEKSSIFPVGMGTHAVNPEYMLDSEVSVEKPEFLNYVRSRKTGRFQLVQMGFMAQRITPDPLFEAEDAQGHFHVGTICLSVDDLYLARYLDEWIEDKEGNFINYEAPATIDIFGTIESSQLTASEDNCKEQEGAKVVGPSLWMMHLAINMYNEFGMFADYFPYVDYLSEEGIAHSFFGEKL